MSPSGLIIPKFLQRSLRSNRFRHLLRLSKKEEIILCIANEGRHFDLFSNATIKCHLRSFLHSLIRIGFLEGEFDVIMLPAAVGWGVLGRITVEELFELLLVPLSYAVLSLLKTLSKIVS